MVQKYRGPSTEAEEASLLASLATLELKPFEFHGHAGNRRVTSFGLRYDYARRIVEPADGFPPFLTELRSKVAIFAGRSIDEFQQGGVNQYPPGAGIGWHKDKPQFGAIVGVSLLSPATMRLRLPAGKSWIRKSQELIRDLSTSLMEKLERGGNTVSLRSVPCDTRSHSERSRQAISQYMIEGKHSQRSDSPEVSLAKRGNFIAFHFNDPHDRDRLAVPPHRGSE